jgi:ADP-heptose:LPS heptosyltransferase
VSKLPKKILVIRLSAMGDVAMTVPVISSLVKEHDVQVYMLSEKFLAPLFINIPNVTFVPFDKKKEHKGIPGLFRLFVSLKKENIDAIADLHDVLRSQFLRNLFRFSAKKVVVIRKGRAGKRKLTKQGKDNSRPQKQTVLRYQEVFKKLGFNFALDFNSIYSSKPSLLPIFTQAFGEKAGKWIGIAPFAKHAGKIYPIQKMEEVIAELNSRGSLKIFLFGNGTEELKVISVWKEKYTSVQKMPSDARLAEELNLMANLDLMVSMDSANMHLAWSDCRSFPFGVPLITMQVFWVGINRWMILLKGICLAVLVPCTETRHAGVMIMPV